MIVYRDHLHLASTAALFEQLRCLLYAMRCGVRHEQAVELLIGFGELEAGLVDSLCPECDRSDGLTVALRLASRITGRIFLHSWQGRAAVAAEGVGPMTQALQELCKQPLPGQLRISIPEGYAYYSLYPETYHLASLKYLARAGRGPVVCLGIRSIGTSLSAVVAASLQEAGVEVDSYTIRPRGDFFNRCLRLDGQLQARLRRQAGHHFLIVDEGPGLSGSSFCATAQKLLELGVAERRISFMPSWVPDGADFVNQAARQRWRRHCKFCASFEEVWLDSGRLGRALPGCALIDVSAGRWRRLFYPRRADYPAVYPSLERRKYLGLPGELSRLRPPPLGQLQAVEARGGELYLLKFAGLGRYGRQACERGRAIAAAGFAPAVLDLVHGFTLSRFVPGRPLQAGDAGEELVETVARYCAFVAQAFPASPDRSFEQMVAMIGENVGKRLGHPWLERFTSSLAGHSRHAAGAVVAVDGHMQPHEWLATPRGYLKVDGTDHHADHFFPGCQDIAWDLAGCQIEFGLHSGLTARLLAAYRRCSGDSHILNRLPFHRIAYLAYRLGFVSLAGEVLVSSSEGARFRQLAESYAAGLKAAILHGGG